MANYDIDRLMQEINLLNIARKIGLHIDTETARLHPDGNKVQCLCPFHNDKTLGSGTTLNIYKGIKGIHCFKCNKMFRIDKVVQQQMNLNWIEALNFMAEDVGGLDQYAIDDSYVNDNGITINAPRLTIDELKLLGINPYENCNRNRRFLQDYEEKPGKFDLADDESIETVLIPNMTSKKKKVILNRNTHLF